MRNRAPSHLTNAGHGSEGASRSSPARPLARRQPPFLGFARILVRRLGTGARTSQTKFQSSSGFWKQAAPLGCGHRDGLQAAAGRAFWRQGPGQVEPYACAQERARTRKRGVKIPSPLARRVGIPAVKEKCGRKQPSPGKAWRRADEDAKTNPNPSSAVLPPGGRQPALLCAFGE